MNEYILTFLLVSTSMIIYSIIAIIVLIKLQNKRKLEDDEVKR